MLFFTTQISAPNGERDEGHWQIGQPVPFKSKYASCIGIQADGNELDYIISRFKNIPITNARVVNWESPFAQFIFDNLG